MIIDEIGKQREQSKEAASREAGAEKGNDLTLKDILANSENSNLFGELLRAEGAEELAQKILEKNLGDAGTTDFESNLDELRKFTKEFNSRLAKVETLNAFSESAQFEEVFKNSPELQRFSELVGKKDIQEALARSWKGMVMSNLGQADKIIGSLKTIEEARKDMQERDGHIGETLKLHGIEEQEFVAILAIADPVERNEKLQELIESYKPSWWDKPHAWNRKKTKEQRKRALEDQENERQNDILGANVSVETALQTLDSQIKRAGGILAITLKNNPEAQKALMDVALSQESPEQEQVELLTPMEAAKHIKTEEEVAEDWAKEKNKAKIGRKDWGHMSDIEQDGFRESFVNKHMPSNKKGGIWATFWGTTMKEVFGLIGATDRKTALRSSLP